MNDCVWCDASMPDSACTCPECGAQYEGDGDVNDSGDWVYSWLMAKPGKPELCVREPRCTFCRSGPPNVPLLVTRSGARQCVDCAQEAERNAAIGREVRALFWKRANMEGWKEQDADYYIRRVVGLIGGEKA